MKQSYKKCFELILQYYNAEHQRCISIYFLTTNKTCCLQDFLFFLLLTPQVGKCIDDDTKDEVEDNNDDHEEEEQVVDHPGCEEGLLLESNRRKGVSVSCGECLCHSMNMCRLEIQK